MPKQLHYPNGRPVPSSDIWGVIEQLAMALTKSALNQKEAKEKRWEGDFGLTPDQVKQSHSHMYRLASFLADAHPAELLSQAHIIYIDENIPNSFFLVRGEYGAYVITSSAVVRAAEGEPVPLSSIHVVIYPEIIDTVDELARLIVRSDVKQMIWE